MSRDIQPSTREESLEGLVVEGGRIRSPGAFEGEAVYVPFFWEKALDGWGDHEDDEGGIHFLLMPDDRRLWPELGTKRVIRLISDENGFVRETPVRSMVEGLVLELLK